MGVLECCEPAQLSRDLAIVIQQNEENRWSGTWCPCAWRSSITI